MAKWHRIRLRTLQAAVAAAALSAPALAAGPTGADLAAWVAKNTDMPPSQVVLAGPENVYSLEPLGPRLPTGELIALVRTEPLSDDWVVGHGFASWDANLLFDCAGGRMREIRSATYSGRNRQGLMKPEPPRSDWMTPKPGEPAARLVSAACDPAFGWPLRNGATSPPTAKATATESGPLPVVETGEPSPTQKVADAPERPPEATPSSSPAAGTKARPAKVAKAAPPSPRAAGLQYAIQIVRGPSEADARKMVAEARSKLGPLGATLAETVQESRIRNGARRYSGFLTGFPTAAAAEAACGTLATATEDCLVRDVPASPSQPAGQTRPAAGGAFFVQLGRGPSEEGAYRIIADARKALGPQADRLTDSADITWLGRKRRYTARLQGFPTAEAADGACRKLIDAGQTCFTRPGS